MKTIFAIISLVVLASCGQDIHRAAHADDPRDAPYTDPELAPYIASFFADAATNGVYTKRDRDLEIIQFSGEEDFEENVLGLCIHKTWTEYDKLGDDVTFRQRMVLVRESTWAEMGECQRRGLIGHEMGHCQLRLDHVDNKDNLMYPYLDVLEDSSECGDLQAKEKVMFDAYKSSNRR
jgi:hypothetical protein